MAAHDYRADVAAWLDAKRHRERVQNLLARVPAGSDAAAAISIALERAEADEHAARLAMLGAD
jgi:hypothetical protein